MRGLGMFYWNDLKFFLVVAREGGAVAGRPSGPTAGTVCLPIGEPVLYRTLFRAKALLG